MDGVRNELFVSEFAASGRLLRVSLTLGGVQDASSLLKVTDASLQWPHALAFYPGRDELFLIEGGGVNNISRISLDGGQVEHFLGGGSASRQRPEPVARSSISLDTPTDLAIDLRGDAPTLFITDSGGAGRVLAAPLSLAYSSCQDLT